MSRLHICRLWIWSRGPTGLHRCNATHMTGVRSHARMSHVKFPYTLFDMFESLWMSHVTHMIESDHTHEWVLSNFRAHWLQFSRANEWVLSHTWKSHIIDRNEPCHTSVHAVWYLKSRGFRNELCHTHKCKWVMSHPTWVMSHLRTRWLTAAMSCAICGCVCSTYSIARVRDTFVLKKNYKSARH